MYKNLLPKTKNPFFDGLIISLFVLNLLPLLAPVLLHLGYTGASHLIYQVYSFFCHQFHWRSLHIYDHQFAWCTRDVFIWMALLMVAIWVRFNNPKPIKWYWIIPFMIPIALDGGIQTIATIWGYSSGVPYYMSTNIMRMLTGGFFGIGLGLVLFPQLQQLINE